jgi:beta-galactosidase
LVAILSKRFDSSARAVAGRRGPLFGAAYYREYLREDRLATDLKLMREAGFTVIRVGESVWSSWEPEEGTFCLDWLQPVLDAAHAHGIAAVLGTPTYAVPPWLRQRYPQTTAEPRTGQPLPYGHRQNVDFSHPTFRRLAERVVRRILERHASHPAVIGFQVDNEPGIELLHNQGVFDSFTAHLRATYGDVDTLNEAWGLTFWSHRITDWSQLWRPDGNSNPAYALEWRRHQARLTAEFIAWQAGIVGEYAGPDQFVTTCLAMIHPALEPVSLATPLDVAAVNPYYGMQDLLTHPAPPRPSISDRPQWTPAPGVWSLYRQADTARGIRQGPFLVTETNATSIGEPHVNYPAYDGQWRQVAWALVARGASMVEYWHWHSNDFGHETYWGGVLGHSRQPGRCYAELARVGAEFTRAGDLLADLTPEEDVAMVVCAESRWAMEFHPPLALPGGTDPDRGSYDRIVGAFYRGLFDAGLQVAVVAPEQLGADAEADDAAALVRRWPVLVVAGLIVAGDAVLQTLLRYAEAGGHLVLGVRTGYADTLARPRATLMPGVLAGAVGATYREFTNLASPVPVLLGDDLAAHPCAAHHCAAQHPCAHHHCAQHPCATGATATAWADGLEPDGAQVLAGYDHPHLGRWAAITTNVYGAGRVSYVGTLPGAELGAALGRWIATRSDAGPATPLASSPLASSPLASSPLAPSPLAPSPLAPSPLPPSVTRTGARTPAGRRLTFLSNWSWEQVTVAAAEPADDLITGKPVDTGDDIALGAWDVRVLISRASDRSAPS